MCDDGDLSQVSIRVSGHELNRSGKFKDPASVVIHLLSRPLLESQVRRRVSAIDNVEILDGHDFVEPITPNPQRVTGAHIVDRDSGAERTLDTDLVVDAMGRSARTPAFLDSMGYGRPAAERSAASAELRQPVAAHPRRDPARVGRRLALLAGMKRSDGWRVFGLLRTTFLDFHRRPLGAQRPTR